jgi:hypothetical protein
LSNNTKVISSARGSSASDREPGRVTSYMLSARAMMG